MPHKKYFSYIRVSTARQGQVGTSLAEQQSAIEGFARKWNLHLVKGFEERETAAKHGRPVFLEMLKELRRGKADGVVIHKIDRSARNLKDWADLGSLVDTGIEVHFAAESLDLNSRGGRLSADIQAVVASDFIRNLREEAKKGLYGRLKQGLFPFRAPVGYVDRGKGEAKTIDPIMGPLVRQAFELYATGTWGLIKLSDQLYDLGLRNKNGRKITINGLSTILHNGFYVGIITIRGESYSGIHKSLISRDVFDQVQAVFEGKNIKKRSVHHFIYRRLIRCSKCGNLLVAELQKGYAYYRCKTRGCTRGCLKEESVTVAVSAALKRIHLSEKERELYRTVAGEMFGEWKDESEREYSEMILRLRSIQEKQGRLIDTYMEGIIDKEDYLRRKEQLIKDEQLLKERIGARGSTEQDLKSKFDEFIQLANSAYLSFESAPYELKRETVDLVTANLCASGKKVAITMHSAFELLASRPAFTAGSPGREASRTNLAFISQIISQMRKNSSVNTEINSSKEERISAYLWEHRN